MAADFIPIARTGWTAYATSWFNDSFLPGNMIDGDKHTSVVTPTTFSFPWEIWVDMGVKQPFNAISFQRRQDGPQDSPGHIQIFTSDDGVFWAGPFVDTVWENTGNAIIQPVPGANAQWVKVSMLGIAAGSRGALSVAEFNVGITTTGDLSSGMTLKCSCSDAPVAFCTLASLTFHAEIFLLASLEGTGTHAFAELVGGPFGVGIGLTALNEQVNVNLSPLDQWIEAWPNLEVHFGLAETLLQPPGNGAAVVTGGWSIIQKYVCVGDIGDDVPAEQSVVAVPNSSKENVCIEDRITKVKVSAGFGSGGGLLFTSSPLGICEGGGGGDVYVGNFQPPPLNDNDLIDQTGNNPGGVCLCVEGGTPPYFFTIISGQLPCGQQLNVITGCITGIAGGACEGTQTATFQVVDAVGHVAQVTCGFLRPCVNPRTGEGEFGNSFY